VFWTHDDCIAEASIQCKRVNGQVQIRRTDPNQPAKRSGPVVMLFVRLVVKHCSVLYYSTVYVNPSFCAIYNSSIFSIIFCTVLPNYCIGKKITVIGNLCVPSTWYLRTLIGQPRGVSIESVTVCVYIVAAVRKRFRCWHRRWPSFPCV
jgi:hypothetical protein